ncbi:unnamed protein product [Mytilus coruscus]|uniref:Uncharacterized protein n=1 Tax=Mytilus coruscus TaxID=42192 RepID=A0A6J8A3J5_MYTCO|nr:unnamed protein product [Mytilus coruscus]
MSMSASTSRPPSDDDIPHKVQKTNSFHLRFDGSDSEEGELPPLKRSTELVLQIIRKEPRVVTAREVSTVLSTSIPNASAMGDVSSLIDTRNSDKGVLSELKILSKKVTDLDKTVKNTDIKIDQILERLAETNTSKTVKASAAPEVPAQVQQAVRDGFGDAENSGLAWKAKTDTGASLKPFSEENKPMSDSIKVFVKGIYPTTQNGIINAGIETYFRSFKNKARMVAAGQMDDHKKKMLK